MPLPQLTAPLPHWMPAALPAQQSLLADFLNSMDVLGDPLAAAQYELASVALKLPGQGEPWRAWRCFTTLDQAQITGIVADVNGQTFPVTPALTPFSFVQTNGPVYYVDPDQPGNVFFRNLAQVTVTIDTPTGLFAPTGTAFAPGEPIILSPGLGEVRIEPEAVSAVSGTVQLPASGRLTVAFTPASGLVGADLGTVAINGGPANQLVPLDLWNNWDGIGLTVDQPRFVREDNASYAQRIYTAISVDAGVTPQRMRLGVARRLGRLAMGAWSGTTPVGIAVSGATDSWIVGVPASGSEATAPLLECDDVWYGPEALWNRSATVFNGSVPVSWTASGDGIVLAGNVVPTSILAKYLYPNYALSTDASGNVSALNPTRNMVAQLYLFGIVFGVQVYTAASPAFKELRLLTPAGAPTSVFYDLAARIDTGVRVAYGFGLWGIAQFFQPTQVTPVMDYIPAVMDE